MKKQAKFTVVGTFVVGAAMLLVVSVLFFGSGRYFRDTVGFVMFFKGTVSGLTVGSPVEFRGVKVGTVSEIMVRYNAKDKSIQIPVFIEIDPSSIEETDGATDTNRVVMDLIKHGMKATLRLQSLLTGQLAIVLDFYPDKPMNIVGLVPEFLEIPTIPSGFDNFREMLQTLPFDEFAENLLSSVEGFDELINSPEIIEAVYNLNLTLQDTQETMEMLKIMFKQSAPLRHDISEALDEVTGAAKAFRILMDYIEQHPESLIRGKAASRN